MRGSLLFLLACLLLTTPCPAQESLEWASKAFEAQEAEAFAEEGEAWLKTAEALKKEKNPPHQAKALFYAGLAFYKGGAKEQAVVALAQAVTEFERLDDNEGQSLCWLQKGVVEIELSLWVNAEHSFRSSVERARAAGNEKRALEATEKLGQTLEAAHRWAEATEVTKELVEAYRTSAPNKVPDLLATLGALYQLQSHLTQAERAYQEAASTFREQQRPKEARDTQRSLARFYLQTHQLEEAYALLSDLVLLFDGQPEQLRLTIDLAYACAELGRHEEALKLIENSLLRASDAATQSLLQARRIEQLQALGRTKEALALIEDEDFGTLHQRSKVAELIHRRDLAEQYLREALTQASGTDRTLYANVLALRLIDWNRPDEAAEILESALASMATQDAKRPVLLSNLGEAHLRRGDPLKALPLFQEALTLTDSSLGGSEVAKFHNNLGATYEYLGNYQKALEEMEKAVSVGERYQVPDPSQGTYFNALGLLYVKLGRTEDGVSLYQKALAYHRTHGNTLGEASSLINLGAAAEILERDAKSREYFEQALAIAQKEERSDLEATIYNNLSQLTENLEEARMFLEKAIERNQRAPNSLTRQILVSNLAENHFQAGNLETAGKLAESAAKALQDLGAKESELVTRSILLAISLKEGSLKNTILQLERSLSLSGDIVLGLSSASARSFLEQRAASMRSAIHPILKAEHLSKAFAVEETLRSLGLVALTNGLPLSSAHVPDHLREQERTLSSRLVEASRRAAKGTAADLRRLRAEYRRVQDQIERYHLAAGGLRRLEPVTLADVQKNLAFDEAIMEYIQAGDSLWVLVVTAADVRTHQLGSMAQLEPLINEVHRRVNSPSKDQETAGAISALSQAFWSPTESYIKQARHLIVIPAGPLYSIPFAVLEDKNGTVIENHSLSLATSASAWVISRQSSSSGKGSLIAALGNHVPKWSEAAFGFSGVRSSALTPLPGTLQELAKVSASMENSVNIIEEKMTGTALEKQSAGRRHLHYATHGLFNEAEPMLSGLVAADRLVTVGEVFNWKLDAELAVLSACHSGELSLGQEYVSLTRAFQFAGVRSLLATQWAVSDTVTALWMDEFTKALKRGERADDATRLAQRIVAKKHPHPYFWAAFTLWGDGAVRPLSPPIEKT